jgi:transposase
VVHLLIESATDVKDAQWLQQLHQFGLLRGSFHPETEISVLRSYMRQRERLLEYAAAHIQHMQKALMQMNVQLHHVVSDITGATGMHIIRSIVGGNHDPVSLAKFRDLRCKASEETICKALQGNYRDEHLFALRQALELYDGYQVRVAECDREIESALMALQSSNQPDKPLPKPRHRTRQPNALSFDVRQALYAVIGVDLTQIHGIGPYLAVKMISECGSDMSRWPSAKHFTSWLCLSPGNKISGGKILSSKTRRSSSRTAALLRLAAVNVGKTQTAMGAFYRRLAARIGKAKAVTATARKLAIQFYNVLRYGKEYCDPGVDYYEKRYQQRVLKNLQTRARQFGMIVLPEAELAEVS